MDHSTEQKLDAQANLAAMQRAARQMLDAGTFPNQPGYPATEAGPVQEGIGVA